VEEAHGSPLKTRTEGFLDTYLWQHKFAKVARSPHLFAIGSNALIMCVRSSHMTILSSFKGQFGTEEYKTEK
jgi:hypothetical protein